MGDEQERHGHSEESIHYNILYDPFVVESLEKKHGTEVVVQTNQGSIRGTLLDVKPDHIVIRSKEANFSIRIQEIIWVMN